MTDTFEADLGAAMLALARKEGHAPAKIATPQAATPMRSAIAQQRYEKAVAMFASGASRKEIKEALGVHEDTVDKYIQRARTAGDLPEEGNG